MDDNFTLSNIILDHKVSVLDVIVSFGARKPAILGQQYGRFFILHEDVLGNVIALLLNELKLPHDEFYNIINYY